MHPQLILAELKIRGSSLATVAREAGVTYSTAYSVLLGQRSRRVETRIAQSLGKTVEEVFPNRYPQALAE